MESLQEKRIAHNRDRAHRHRKTGKLLAQDYAEAYEYTRGNRDPDHVIEECEEHVLVDFIDCRSTELDRCHYITHVIFHKHDAARFHCDIRPTAHGDAKIRLCKCRSIIDAVA